MKRKQKTIRKWKRRKWLMDNGGDAVSAFVEYTTEPNEEAPGGEDREVDAGFEVRHGYGAPIEAHCWLTNWPHDRRDIETLRGIRLTATRIITVLDGFLKASSDAEAFLNGKEIK